ncbi:MAG: class I SAM-dependent methyltransferase, partial [Actinomycetota bacterium]|nr:class I SAM-dependent methyltransferase [Actinomycetota bacterium]
MSDTERNDGHVEEVATWFDTRAKEWSDLYDEVRRVNDIVLIDRKDAAVAFMRGQLDPGARILDVGCGAGVTARDLVHAGFVVHGVDISQNMIDRAERRLAESGAPPDSYLFTRADVLEASLPAASFDGVVALGFIQY